MGLFYGATTQLEIVGHARRVAQAINPDNAAQAVELMLGTACAETGLATAKDNYEAEGRGLCQFDSIRFDDVRTRLTNEKPYIMDIFDREFGIKWLQFEHLDYSPLASLLMCRCAYLFIPEALPEVGMVQEQAEYWKKHYNTSAGKGSVSHYMKMYNHHYMGGQV